MIAETTPRSEASSRKAYLGAGLFLLLLLVLFGIGMLPRLRHREALAVEAREAGGPPFVLATRVQARSAEAQLELPATIEAFDQTPVYARTSGYVRQRLVDIGDHVRQGQLLAVIDDPQTAQSLLQARATLAQLKAQLAQAQANAQLSRVTSERWQALEAQGVVAHQDADQKRAQAGADAAAVAAAEANVAAGEANVRNLTEQAGFARVVAPFAGVILSRGIDTGSLISAGSTSGVTQLFSIGKSEVVRVFADVPQTASTGLHAGVPAQVQIRELPGQTFTGAIARTSQSIDPTTRTLHVEVDLHNDGRILPGMYATLRMQLAAGATPTVLLPANALVVRSAGPQAFVIGADHVVHLRALTLGRDLGALTEVTAGLSPGDMVVLSPGDNVMDNVKVQPTLQQ